MLRPAYRAIRPLAGLTSRSRSRAVLVVPPTMPISSEDIDALFPLPSSPPSALCPTPLSGTTHESKVAVTKTLKDNHTLWHAYLNDMGFHK